jgi:uncharacterized protein (TIGR03437 family)
LRYFRLIALAFTYSAILAAAPSITGVYNAAGWIPPNLPNSGVAQGAIFTVTGAGLGPSILQQAESYPLPTTQGLGGTTMQVTVAGVTETCIMVYTVATQVAAILPSATPVGTGTLMLSYQGSSTSFAIRVLAAGVGTFTLNEGGTGPGVFTDSAYNPITMVNAAHPGDTLILWGSGLGPVTGDETEPPTQIDLGTGVQVLVGNQPATVTYGGRGSSPGLDQINFVVPAGITGCKTSVVVIVKGITGNVTTLSVAPAGQTTCGDTFNALTAANLQKAVSSGSLSLAGVTLTHTPDTGDTLLADFGTFPLNSLIRSYGGTPAPSVGNCIAYEILNNTLTFTDPILPTPLSTGSQLMITGPNGNKTVDVLSPGLYASELASSAPFFIAPGNYTITNGSGGADVATFNWNLTLPASIVPTNIPASVDLSQDLTLTWTGGSAYSVVTIVAFNGVPTTPSLNSYTYIICTAAAGAGTFTIPSAILSLLPPDGYGSLTSKGVNIQIAGVADSIFTGANAPGLDEGFFTALISSGSVAKIQ